MPTNIVFCIDGTGNTPLSGGAGTNVFRLYNAVDVNLHRRADPATRQVAFYDEGVGTEDSRVIRTFSAATGKGIAGKIQRLYTQLVMVYSPGDRLFFFGFSRGAFAIRHMVSLIASCGIIDRRSHPTLNAVEKAVSDAIRHYRRRHYRRDRAPRRVRTALDPAIDFIGVWDTVDSVGIPWQLPRAIRSRVYAYSSVDSTPAIQIKYACQCLAIDEERRSFSPVMWSSAFRSFAADSIEQVWFPGVHSNVGGGYERGGLSGIALDWMMGRAEDHGLRFTRVDRELAHAHQSYNDRLYDSRAGLGRLYLWRPRDIGRLSAANGIASPQIHVSAFERILNYTDFYAPAIPPNFTIVAEDLSSKHEVSLDPMTAGQCSATHEASRRVVSLGALATMVRLVTLLALLAVVAVALDARARDGNTSGALLLAIGALAVLAIASSVCAAWCARHRRRLYLDFWLRNRQALLTALRTRSTATTSEPAPVVKAAPQG